MSDFKSEPTPIRPEDDLHIPPHERKTVATLLSTDCRWPFGDPTQQDFHFCGKRQRDGSPYCEFHARRAFQAVRRPTTVRPAVGATGVQRLA